MLKKTLFFSFCLALCAQSTVLLAGGVNMDDMCDAEKKASVVSAPVTTLPAFFWRMIKKRLPNLQI